MDGKNTSNKCNGRTLQEKNATITEAKQEKNLQTHTANPQTVAKKPLNSLYKSGCESESH